MRLARWRLAADVKASAAQLGRRGGERRADGQPEPGWSGATLNREYYCSCSLALKAGETHRPYPAWSLRSGPRSGRLTKQMHFVCEPTRSFLAPQFTSLAGSSFVLDLRSCTDMQLRGFLLRSPGSCQCPPCKTKSILPFLNTPLSQ